MTTTVTTTQSAPVHMPTSAILGDLAPEKNVDVTLSGTPEASSSPLTAPDHRAILAAASGSDPSSPATALSGSPGPCTSGLRPILPAPPRPPPPPPPLPPPPLRPPLVHERKASMSGLLDSKNLDEKLVVATLATLNSGTASSLIKQDLKWIIQSRRKAEGKAELQVEFKKPVKEEQLTSEEVVKRSRRRELNRLAARRSREKGQRRKDMLVEEIRKLQSHNTELMDALGNLTEQRNQIIDTLRQHMKQCSDYEATQKASVGLSHRVLKLLGFPTHPEAEASPQPSSLTVADPQGSSSSPSSGDQPPPAVSEVPGMSALYISTSDLVSSSKPQCLSPGLHKLKADFESCPSSPQVSKLTFESLSSCPNSKLLPTTASVESLLANSAAGLDQGGLSKVHIMLPSPSPLKLSEIDSPVFLVSSSAMDSPLHLASPASLRTETGPSSLNLSEIQPAPSDVFETNSLPSSLSPSFTYPVLNFQTTAPTVISPLLPKASSIKERRRSSTASLPGSGEGIATFFSHSGASAPSDSGLGSSQEEGGEVREEDVVHYKHKLMKHRKQHSTDFTHPSHRGHAPGEGGGRGILLERSFSFPSSRCEQLRSSSSTSASSGSSAASSALSFPLSQASSALLGFLHHANGNKASTDTTCTARQTVSSTVITSSASATQASSSSLSSSFSSSEEPSALNNAGSKSSSSSSKKMILKFRSAKTSSSSDAPRVHHVSDTAMDEEKSMDVGDREIRGWTSPMDTWPPAGSPRSSHQSPWRLSVLERRWSVDDYSAMPLNLSRRNSQEDNSTLDESEKGGAVSSRSSSPSTFASW